jgi:hypothetical protein
MYCWQRGPTIPKFDREVTVSGYDQEGETKSPTTVPVVLGCNIPEICKTVLLPQLEHNLLITMQMRLHYVVLSGTPKFQCLEPTNISHTVTVRVDFMDDVLTITLDFNGVVSCFPKLKPTQEEFDTFDRATIN